MHLGTFPPMALSFSGTSSFTAFTWQMERDGMVERWREEREREEHEGFFLKGQAWK